MCGIAGIFSYHYASHDVDREELRRIRDYMIKRGPDGYGEWYSKDGHTGLAHRRLSIIDLSERGAQPMLSSDGNYVVTFNGEIYNYRALRTQLEAKGCIFRSNSDTEVLLHLYADRGAAMVNDLRGMFAFGLWDAKQQSLLLARDPYGIKPLYYADDGWTLRFASQVKALLAGEKISREPEAAGWVGYYLFGHVPEPYTTFQQIRTLPAGCYMWVNQLGPHEPKRYFSIAQVFAESEKNPVNTNDDDTQQYVREALLDSVRHHLVADVPIGAFLSAGVDSGALEDPFPPRRIEESPQADAIVILGGSVGHARRSGGSENLTQAADRVLYGFRLFRSGLAPLVVVSGGGPANLGQPESEAMLMARLLEEWGVPPSAIRRENASLDTRGNALGCKRLLKGSGIHEILLVTSAAHMRRALATFQNVGFLAVPASTDHESGDDSELAIRDWIPQVEALELTSLALREYLAFLYYSLRGWTSVNADRVTLSSGASLS